MSTFADYTVDELKAFRKELAKAIASGSLRVKFADREVTYRSLVEMRQAASMLDEELDVRVGTPRLRRLRVDSQKGFR